jgi:MFS transporter, SP family, galactose:H+ symporter
VATYNPSSPENASRGRALLYLTVGIAALGGLLFGYDTGVISGALLYLNESFHLTSLTKEVAVSSVLVGAILGAIIASWLSNAVGRRLTLLITAFIFTIGALLTAFSPNLIIFVLWRLVVGVSIGLAASVVPAYISEIAPARWRGMMVTLYQLAITIGIAVSYWVDLAFAHAGMGWPPMFAIAAVPSVIFLLGMLINPETPRWLGSRGRWAEADKVLTRVTGEQNNAAALTEIRASLTSEQTHGAVRELLRPGLRVALLVGVGLAAFQQLIGINTIVYYAPTIFGTVGFSSNTAAIMATSIVGVVNVCATIVACLLVDRAGRRPLLLWGTAGMVIALLGLSLVFWLNPAHVGGLTLLLLMLYIVAFAIGMGPVFWVLSAKLFPTNVRTTGASISTFFNWVANLLVSITFLSLIDAIGTSWTFTIYAFLGVIAFCFILRLVPETRQKSLEHIERYWQNGGHWETTEQKTAPTVD